MFYVFSEYSNILLLWNNIIEFFTEYILFSKHIQRYNRIYLLIIIEIYFLKYIQNFECLI